RGADVDIRIHNAGMRAMKLRVGLVSPSGIDFLPEEQWISLSAAAESKVLWRCDPQRRGRFLIRGCYLEAGSTLGFWSIRRKDEVSMEVRTYPNLRADALQALRRGMDGRRALRQVGRGREFEKLREYTPGDSSDEIHWKATARRARPITKVFQVERTQEVYLGIGTSRLAGRESGGEESV